jgi:hypothetical protein
MKSNFSNPLESLPDDMNRLRDDCVALLAHWNEKMVPLIFASYHGRRLGGVIDEQDSISAQGRRRETQLIDDWRCVSICLPLIFPGNGQREYSNDFIAARGSLVDSHL